MNTFTQLQTIIVNGNEGFKKEAQGGWEGNTLCTLPHTQTPGCIIPHPKFESAGWAL